MCKRRKKKQNKNQTQTLSTPHTHTQLCVTPSAAVATAAASTQHAAVGTRYTVHGTRYWVPSTRYSSPVAHCTSRRQQQLDKAKDMTGHRKLLQLQPSASHPIEPLVIPLQFVSSDDRLVVAQRNLIPRCSSWKWSLHISRLRAW